MSIKTVGFSEMVSVEATYRNGNKVNVEFPKYTAEFTIRGRFANGEIVSLKYVYIAKNYNLFYKSQSITVGTKGEYYGKCKVDFEVEGDFIILGTKSHTLQFDGEKVYYEDACPDTEFTDYVILSKYAAKWRSSISWNAQSYYNKNAYLRLAFPRQCLGGNNFILENNLSTPYVDYIDDYYVKNNGTHYLINYDKPKEGEINTKNTVTFMNAIDNEFVYPMNESQIIDTSTEKTRAKALEILANDTSDEPDYFKLGRWINTNMRYDSNYENAKWTVDEILEKLIGGSYQLTRLYNAFLFSIGIKAVCLRGFLITGKGGTPESAFSVKYAWTMAKINGKWKGLDATNGIFLDKFPISHVFGYNSDITYSEQHNSVYPSTYPYFEMRFLEFIDKENLRQLKEEVEDAVFLREENVKKKEAELEKFENNLKTKESYLKEKEENLNKKEKELKNTEIQLNNKNSTLQKKEEELINKENELNNRESEIKPKEDALINREKELNETESKLNEREIELNEKSEQLHDCEIELKNFEKNLNETKDILDEKETELNLKENKLMEKENELDTYNSTLIIKEKELIKIEENLNIRESNLKPKEESLYNKEIELNEKEKELSGKETELNQKENNLNKKESDLNAKEETLNTRETNINIREDNVYKKEQSLETKEEELNNLENTLNEKESNLTIKEETLNTKEEELNKREEKLNDNITIFNEKKDNNAIYLIIVSVLLGISIIIIIICIICRVKYKKGIDLSAMEKSDDKVKELNIN